MLASLLLIICLNNVLCELEIINEKNNKNVLEDDEANNGDNLYKNVLDLASKKIDKDTIINRNFKLEKKSSGKNAPSNQDSDPDLTYASFPEEVASHVAAFKRNMTDCLKEVQRADKRVVQSLSPNKESPINGECLIACVLKRNGVLEDGKVNTANLVLLLRKFYGSKSYDLGTLERCAARAQAQRDECRAAAALSACAGDLAPHGQGKRQILI